MSKESIQASKENINDEYYTLYCDIEKELSNYTKHFQRKTVYCNCDDPRCSEFWRYFHLHFKELGLYKLVATFLNKNSNEISYKYIYWGGNDSDVSDYRRFRLNGRGDFRDAECLLELECADVIVTNPPFSLLNEFYQVIEKTGKDYVFIGNKNLIGYKYFTKAFKCNRVRAGYTEPTGFKTPDGTVTNKLRDMCKWFTSFDLHINRNVENFTGSYSEQKNLIFDNYPAWNVDACAEIPNDTRIIAEVSKKKAKQIKTAYGTDAKIIDGIIRQSPSESLNISESSSRSSENKKKNEGRVSDETEEPENVKIEIDRPVWGVPITYISKHNPDNFDIITFRQDLRGNLLIFSREEEQIFNEAFGMISDSEEDKDNNKEAWMYHQMESFFMENAEEPIDYFYPEINHMSGYSKAAVAGKIKFGRIMIRPKNKER